MNFTRSKSKSKPLLRPLLLTLVLTLLCAVNAQAGKRLFSLGVPSTSTNRSVVIVSADGDRFNVGLPVIKFLSVTSDLATAVVSFYRAGAPTSLTAASGGGTNRVFLNGWTTASNAVVVIRHVASDTYERMVTFTNTTTTLTFTTATASAVAANDQIYVMTLDATLLVGAATRTDNVPQGLYVGQQQRPILVEVNGTTLSRINLLTGEYVPD